MRFGNILGSLCLVSVVLLFCGCESSNAPKHTGPLTAADVKIYKDPPSQEHKDLGPVTLATGGEVTWDERGDSTRGFYLLKEKVAKMGGNGILLKIDQSEYDMQVLAADNGTYYQVPLKRSPRSVIVHALSVKE